MAKTVIVTLVCTVFLASAVWAQPVDPQYGWTLSFSPDDPYQNEAPFNSGGILSLYLWYACSDTVPGGMAGAEFSLVYDATNLVLAFSPANGFLNAGSATDLLLAVGGCPVGPIVAGSFLILTIVPGQYCLGPTISTGNRLVVDCDPQPATHDLAFIGFSDDGNPPCSDGPDPLCPIPVTLQSISIE